MSAYLQFVARGLRILVIVLTVLGFGRTMLGCSGGTVRVVPLYATGFQHMLDVDIESRGRWPAHRMRRWIRGEASDEVGAMDGNLLPEPYIADDAVLGKYPSEYHLAYAGLTLLREYYAATHPWYQVPEDVTLLAAVEAADGSPREVVEYERNRELDIVDIGRRQLFEAVPRGDNHLAGGKNKVDGLLKVMNRAMSGVPEFTLGKGFAGEVGVRFAEEGRPWRLSWKTVAPGIIAYQWQVLGAGIDDDDDKEAYLKDRWHEPTVYEKTRFARALHEVVERLVYEREKLGPTRAATEMPMLPGQTAADYRRSVALWSASGDTGAQLLPIVRADAPEGVRVPEVIAKRLAGCSGQSAARLKPERHTMSFNVVVTNKGRAVSASVEQSTLGNRETEACMVEVLRKAQWPQLAAAAPAAPAAPALKTFLAQPAPAVPPPDFADRPSGIYPKQPSPPARPASDPGGVKIPPRFFVIPLGPVAAAAAVFGIIYFWSSEDAPAWQDELNPITRQRYTSEAEYEQVRGISPQEILQRQQAHIKATQSQPPPAPAPDIKAQREQEKKAQRCAKLAGEIKDLITAKRPATPPGGYPQGYQGLAKRWEEYAENRGNWGPGKNVTNHIKQYRKEQERLQQKLVEWTDKGCEEKDLPVNARQYAAQEPELGPGKRLEPKPTPAWYPAASLAVSAPQDQKRSK